MICSRPQVLFLFPSRLSLGLVPAVLAALLASACHAQTTSAKPRLSASHSTMAGSMLSVSAASVPAGARLAIARPDDPASRAIVVVPLPASAQAFLPTPGMAGSYELRLTQERDGAAAVLLRQPLIATPPAATLSAPGRVARGNMLPVRGIGPNGEQDRVVLAPEGAPADAAGPAFFPAENVEATLEAPDQPGRYELRYVMHAPLAEHTILASRSVVVE